MLKDEGKRVVYWLGAGASAQALPVVGEMKEAMAAQHAWVYRLTDTIDVNPIWKQYFTYLHKLTLAYEPYGTVDTYARSLYVQERRDELAELKLHLALFFLLEQIDVTNEFRGQPLQKIKFTKTYSVDPRYMGLLALLVEKGRKLSNRVNLVSWNYDVQVEHALSKYWQLQDLSYLHGMGNGLVHPGRTNTQRTGRLPFLIHLNGVAGHGMHDAGPTCYYGPLISAEPRNMALYLLEKYGQYLNGNKAFLSSMLETFTFAWEEKPMAQEGIRLAKMAMQNADVLVIIGYSFPTFNRAIDRELYKAFEDNRPGTKYIVVQDPNLAVETFQKMMGIRGEYPNVHMVRDTSQFHVPFDMF